MRSSAGVVLLLPLIALPGGALRAEGAWSAPATPGEVKARIEELRSVYRPYLRSLPQPTAFSALVKGYDGECPCCRRPFADVS